MWQCLALPFAKVIPKVCNGIFAVADQLRLCLSAVILFAFDIRQYRRYLTVWKQSVAGVGLSAMTVQSTYLLPRLLLPQLCHPIVTGD